MQVLSILHGYESWTLNAGTERSIDSIEDVALLLVRHTEHKTDYFVREIIHIAADQQEPHPATGEDRDRWRTSAIISSMSHL